MLDARPSLSPSMTDSFIIKFYFCFTCMDVLSACMSLAPCQGFSILSSTAVFILQTWPRGHHSSLYLQVESPSLPQALRTCTGWRKSSGAPAMPSPLLSPATQTTASRTQYSRDHLGRDLSTMSRSLFMAPLCCDTALSAKALLGRADCAPLPLQPSAAARSALSRVDLLMF